MRSIGRMRGECRELTRLCSRRPRLGGKRRPSLAGRVHGQTMHGTGWHGGEDTDDIRWLQGAWPAVALTRRRSSACWRSNQSDGGPRRAGGRISPTAVLGVLALTHVPPALGRRRTGPKALDGDRFRRTEPLLGSDEPLGRATHVAYTPIAFIGGIPFDGCPTPAMDAETRRAVTDP